MGTGEGRRFPERQWQVKWGRGSGVWQDVGGVAAALRGVRSGDFLSASPKSPTLSPGTPLGSDKCRTEQEGGNLKSRQMWKSRHEAES